LSELPDKIRVVFDTNIYIAAFLKTGLADLLLRQADEGKFQVFSSEPIFLELRKKLITKFGVEKERADQFCTRLKKQTLTIKEPVDGGTAGAVEDPEDEKILTCALAVKAHIIVSMDKHLLKLKDHKEIKIVHPKTLTWMIPNY